MKNTLDFLSTKAGFNTALGHFKISSNFISRCGQRFNLADLINEALDNGQLSQYQISPLLNALLIDKFKYHVESFNFTKSVADPSFITSKVKDWNALDFVIAYYHPQLGQIVINPKNKSAGESVSGGFKENELAVLYSGNYGNDFNNDLAMKSSLAIIDLLHGKSVNLGELSRKLRSASTPQSKTIEKKAEPEQPVPKPQTTQQVSSNQQPEPQPAQQSPSGAVKNKLSPSYGILVSNELFHNGNVEAWKKIIESYHAKYHDMKVFIFYEKEQIHDINTLFKWGKVKHGTMIDFRLLGPEFKDISKLRRYLTQGASIRFEAFLKGAVGQVLPLF